MKLILSVLFLLCVLFVNARTISVDKVIRVKTSDIRCVKAYDKSRFYIELKDGRLLELYTENQMISVQKGTSYTYGDHLEIKVKNIIIK